MQHEIKLNGKTLLFVGLPENVESIKVYGKYFNYWTKEAPYNSDFPVLILIPKGGFELLGLHPNLAEEKAMQIVENITNSKRYLDYLT